MELSNLSNINSADELTASTGSKYRSWNLKRQTRFKEAVQGLEDL